MKKTGVIWGVVATFALSGVFVVQAASTKDPFLSDLWYLKAIQAPSVIPAGKVPLVAILDAGFDLNHEDLQNQYWKNEREIAGDKKDNDNNGYDDDVSGWDFVDGDANPSPDISDPMADDTIVSHGTVLAGMIAAQANNGKGIAGIAPNAKIMPLRILDSKGKGTTLQVRDAITYAVKNGADVINLSLVSTKPDDQLQQVIGWAVDQGVVVVAAVGNANMDVNRDPTFPVCFDTRMGKNRVIGVAALDQNKKKATFSNSGSNCVDISAPGVNISGAVYHDASNFLYSTSYGSPFEGTSLAAPMVTAAVALLRSAYPTLTPEQIRLAIMLSADPLLNETPERRAMLGAGALNIERALQIAVQFIGGKPSVDARNPNLHPTRALVIAEGAGSSPIVKRVDENGTELNAFFAYDPKFRGGVRVAVGDVNGDGYEEIITAPGAGGGPHVRIFDVQGKLLHQFFAFDPSDRKGLFVSTGDVNHDGIDEILVSQGQGGSGQVRMFTKRGDMIGSFYPFGRTTSPISVTVGNFDEDPELEIASALSGTDQTRRIKIFDANGRYIRDFSALSFLKSGLRVSTVHSMGSTIDQILVSAEGKTQPWVGIYNHEGKLQNASLVLPQGFTGGIQAVSADLNQDGHAELYSVPVSGGGPQVRVFTEDFAVTGGFFGFVKSNRFGLSIAVWDPS